MLPEALLDKGKAVLRHLSLNFVKKEEHLDLFGP